MQGWNKGNSVVVLNGVCRGALKLPVGVINHHYDARPHTRSLHEHFLFLF